MFAALDWQSMTSYTYLAIAGGAVIVLATGLSAVPGGRLKVPGIVVAIVGGLGLGLALGVLFMGGIGYQFEKPQAEPSVPRTPEFGVAGPGPSPPGAPAGMSDGANKAQLAALVGKLDLLTEKPLAVHLGEEQQKEVANALQGLAEAEELSDDDAKAKIEKLHELLKEQKETLEAAGYRWSGQGGGRGSRGAAGPPAAGPQPTANPFKAEQNADHLKRLTERLNQGAKE